MNYIVWGDEYNIQKQNWNDYTASITTTKFYLPKWFSTNSDMRCGNKQVLLVVWLNNPQTVNIKQEKTLLKTSNMYWKYGNRLKTQTKSMVLLIKRAKLPQIFDIYVCRGR